MWLGHDRSWLYTPRRSNDEAIASGGGPLLSRVWCGRADSRSTAAAATGVEAAIRRDHSHTRAAHRSLGADRKETGRDGAAQGGDRIGGRVGQRSGGEAPRAAWRSSRRKLPGGGGIGTHLRPAAGSRSEDREAAAAGGQL